MLDKNSKENNQPIPNLNFNQKVEKTKEIFCLKNSISPEIMNSERYLVNFRDKLSIFFSRILSEENGEEILEIIINILEEHYRYYSKNSFDEFYDFTFNELKKIFTEIFGDVRLCKFASVLNKNPSVYNSSKHMVTLFIEKFEISNYFIDGFITDIFNLEYNLSKLQENISQQRLEISNSICKFVSLTNDNISTKRLKNKINHAIKNLEENLSDLDSIEEKLRKKRKNAKKVFKTTRFLVLLDDFSGSGETIIDYLNILQKYLPSTVHVLIFCLHGMSIADQKLYQWRQNNTKINVTVKFFTVDEKFFDKIKSLSQDVLDKFKNFEKNSVLDEDETKYILGYGETQALVTNYRNTPNNTFSIFWKKSENKKWSPLFPRHEKYITKEYNLFDANQCTFIRQNIYDSFTNKLNDYPDLTKNKLLGVIIFLVYTNQNEQKFFKNEDNDVVNELVKDYNSNVLQDCLNHKLLEDSEGHYTLSEPGYQLLEKIKLSNATLDSLAKSKVFSAEDALPPGSKILPNIST